LKEEMQQLEAERSRAREEQEARWIEEQNLLVQKKLEKRLAEEKAKAKVELLQVKQKLKEDLERVETERVKAMAVQEARWIEDQNLLVQKRLEKRLAKEKAKAKAEISQAKRKMKEEQERIEKDMAKASSDEKTRWIEEQNLLVQERLEKRLSEEKAKVNAEILQVKQEMKKEHERFKAEKLQAEETLEKKRLQLRLSELKDEQDSEANSAGTESSSTRDDTISANAFLPPQRSSKFTQSDTNSDKTADMLPPDTQSTTSEPALMSADPKDNVSDALAADVEALELISMCQADFDTQSPIQNAYSTSQKGSDEQICLLPTEYPFVSLLRDSSPYIVNHRHSTIVYHIPGDLISNAARFNSVMDDIALTWLFGMKIVISVGCRKQILQRLERLHGKADDFDPASKLGVRVTTPETLRILEEEAGFCRFEVERLLNRCLRNKGADCNVVSGCFITAKKFGIVDGVDYQHTGYPTTLQTDRIHRFHSRNDVVLLTPLGFTKYGDALNIHSEALAAFTAGALGASKIVYFSSHPMILRGSTDDNSNQRIQMIQRSNVLQILSHYGLTVQSETGFPQWGKNINPDDDLDDDQQAMLLKMGWATHALDRGVERAHIIDCEDGALLEELFTARRGYGTCISQDDYEAPHPEDCNDDLSVTDGAVAEHMER